MRKTHFIFKSYDQDSQLYADGCNSIIFLNAGTNTCTINGTIILATNASISLNGNIGDQDHTHYSIRFAGAGTNILNTISKFDSEL